MVQSSAHGRAEGQGRGAAGGAKWRESRLFPQNPVQQARRPHSPAQPGPSLARFRPQISICWLKSWMCEFGIRWAGF